MKKIVYVSTSRSEFHASRFVIEAINNESNFDLTVFVGGNHCEEKFGLSLNEILNYGYKIELFPGISENRKELSLCYAETLIKLSNYFSTNKPDLIILNGDRLELMPYVISAAMHQIAICHIGGGDITQGSTDNEIRYAISKFAHLHFVSCQESANNLIKSGEDIKSICVTGQCGLENIIRTEKISLEETSKAIGLDLSIPTAVCIYYPSRELGVSVEEQIDIILNALHETNTQTVFVYPCSEIGSDIIRNKIDEYCKTHDNCKAFANLENKLFQSLLTYCAFMIGNSSAGMIESPFIDKYTINVGNRQKGRYVNDTVFMCDYKEWQLIDAIMWCINEPLKSFNIENIELPSKKIIQAIKENIEKPELLYKKILL